MGLFDFLKKKKKGAAANENETADTEELGVIDPPEIEPPETRYTQEYQDFLAAREKEEGERELPDEAADGAADEAADEASDEASEEASEGE